MRAWCNGSLIVDPTVPRSRSLDHGFTVGDGVFEAIKVVDKRPFALTRHLDRLAFLRGRPRAARARRRPRPRGGRGGPRGPGLHLSAGSASPTPPASRRSARAATRTARPSSSSSRRRRRRPDDEGGRHRALAAQRARRDRRPQDHVVRRERGRARVRRGARRLGGDLRQHRGQPLRGHRAPTSSASSTASSRTRRCRPAACPASPATWSSSGAASTSATSRCELADADEVFLTSTTRDVQAVHRVDDRVLPAPGPVTAPGRRRAVADHAQPRTSTRDG